MKYNRDNYDCNASLLPELADLTLKSYQEHERNFPESEFNSDDYLYLGTFRGMDLYWYESPDGPNDFGSTPIYVFGPESHEYGSGRTIMVEQHAEQCPEYKELFMRLVECGYATNDMIARWYKRRLENDIRAWIRKGETK